MPPRGNDELDPSWLALSRLRRRRFQQCIDSCSEILAQSGGRDVMVWALKTRAMSTEAYIDETELEAEGVGELLLDSNAIASMPRPGTSLSAPAKVTTSDGSIRPISSSGRPTTGFARPGSGMRTGTAGMSVDQAFKGNKPGTARPMTTLGREVRLGTASMQSSGGVFIDVGKLDLRKYAGRPALAIALVDYLLFVEVNPRKALELSSHSTERVQFKSWLWKRRLGQAYYKLGLYRDAEKQLRSSLKDQPMLMTYFDLAKVYLKLDIPNTALDLLHQAGTTFPREPRILLSIARVYDMLGDTESSTSAYKKVLSLDSSSLEAQSNLALNAFYSDNPEVALRHYRRLLQSGHASPELWSNLGLACFHSSQWDMSLSCFSRALQTCSPSTEGDIWYNIGLVGVGIGDLSLAYQSFKISETLDPSHAESCTNLGVLDLRKSATASARRHFEDAKRRAPHLWEPAYNLALLMYKEGDLETASENVREALMVHPTHADAIKLKKTLDDNLMGAR